MLRIGSTIRSAKMKATTPPKLIPPFHSTAASGTLPIEQTNDSIATSGPTSGPHSLASSGWEVRKKPCQKLAGTQAPSAPAISNPPAMSFHTETQSITKEWLIAVNPFGEVTRDQIEPSVTDMSMAAWPSITPTRPLSACCRAACTSGGFSRARNSSASSTIISGPPTNSAAVNCQPSSTARMMPSSMTRLVEANSKAMALVKSAPLRNTDRAIATAAYEQEEEAAPSPQAIESERGESSGSSRPISALETTAWTAPEIAKPRISAHRISHAMAAARLSACPSASRTITVISVQSVAAEGPVEARGGLRDRELGGILLRSVGELPGYPQYNQTRSGPGATSSHEHAGRGGAASGDVAAGRRPGGGACPGGRDQSAGCHPGRPRSRGAAGGVLGGGPAAGTGIDVAGARRAGPPRPGPPSRRTHRGADRHPAHPWGWVVCGALADRLGRRRPRGGRLVRVRRWCGVRSGGQSLPAAASHRLAGHRPLAGDRRDAAAGRGGGRGADGLAPPRPDRPR